jgi:hypothetical protein
VLQDGERSNGASYMLPAGDVISSEAVLAACVVDAKRRLLLLLLLLFWLDALAERWQHGNTLAVDARALGLTGDGNTFERGMSGSHFCTLHWRTH